MRILLVNPWIVDFKAYDEWMRPLPLYHLVEKLAPHHDVHLLDCLSEKHSQTSFHSAEYARVEVTKPSCYSRIPRIYKRYGMSLSRFRAELEALDRPDIVGITSLMSYWYLGVDTVINEVQKIWPKIRCVVGGLYPTLLAEFCKPRYNTSTSHQFLEEIGTRNNGGLRFLTAEESDGVLPLRLQEGCPFDCEYCASSAIHANNLRPLPTHDNLKRVEVFAESGGRDIVWYDDALLYQFNSHLEPFLKEVTQRYPQLRFHTTNGIHARYIDTRVAESLYQYGFKTFRIGYEHHDLETKANGTLLKHATTNLRKAGFANENIGVYLLIGAKQGLDETRGAASFVHSLQAKVYLNQISPVPGSALYENYRKRFPEISEEPLLHNDSSFLFTHLGYDWNEVQAFKNEIRNLNAKVSE